MYHGVKKWEVKPQHVYIAKKEDTGMLIFTKKCLIVFKWKQPKQLNAMPDPSLHPVLRAVKDIIGSTGELKHKW